LNQAIREDNSEQLEAAMPLIGGINQLCVTRGGSANRWPADNRTYRGAGLPIEHRSFFIEGKKYRVNMFLATSFKREKAMEFARADYARAGNPPTMFIFHYSAAGCVHVNYIKSLIPEESEFLFPAFSVFTVRSTNFSSSTAELSEIHLDVAPDNFTESENLPLSPWH
jgi:hypothetical protein